MAQALSVYGRLREVLAAIDVPAGARTAQLARERLDTGPHPQIVSFINAHAFNLAARDASFASALIESDMLLRDGSGMKLLMKTLGREPGPNLNGTDLIPELLSEFIAEKRPIALMGTSEPWLSKAGEAITAQGGTVVLSIDGFQPDAAYAEALKGVSADLVILAMGMPKQEMLAQRLKSVLEHPCLIVNGGAVLDFIAGKVPRAPVWMRRTGVEWIYRLLREPRRLFTRYIVGNVVFVWRTLRLKAGAA